MKDTDFDSFFKELGEKIVSYRKEQNLTQAQLGEKIGVSQQLIAAYENSERHLPIISLFKIAQVLHVEIEDLLGLQKKGKPGPIPVIRRKLEQVQNLPPNKQKLIIDFLDSFLQTNTKKVS
jgi:transcriptional regulator with XRE-family HTH domain